MRDTIRMCMHMTACLSLVVDGKPFKHSRAAADAERARQLLQAPPSSITLTFFALFTSFTHVLRDVHWVQATISVLERVSGMEKVTCFAMANVRVEEKLWAMMCF